MIELCNGAGLAVTISPVGAAVTELRVDGMSVGDRGAIKGRCANRIAGARFTLDGVEYRLSANEGENHLHGGQAGFSARTWEVRGMEAEAEAPWVALTLTSGDGDQGYPGTCRMTVTYILAGRELRICFEAVTDAVTVVNPVNHLYLNLNGGGPVAGTHRLQVDAAACTPVDAALIPTGEVADVAGTRYDFRVPRVFDGAVKGEYDVNLALSGWQEAGEASPDLRRVATLEGLRTGLRCNVFTDRPGLQLYNTPDRICLEAQAFPDAIHHPAFPGTVLRPGERFTSATVYAFS